LLFVVCLLKGVKLSVQSPHIHGVHVQEQGISEVELCAKRCCQHTAHCVLFICLGVYHAEKETSESGETTTVRLFKLKTRFKPKPNHTPWLPKQKAKLRPREVADPKMMMPMML
jgi:hypothetical protein